MDLILKSDNRMKFLNSPWLLIISILITIIGLVTGKFFFLFLILPLSLFGFRKKDRED